jgi:hypothetical protein
MAGLFENDIKSTDLQLHEQGDALISAVDASIPFTRSLRKGKTQTSSLAAWGAYFPNEKGRLATEEGKDKATFDHNKPVTLRSMCQINTSPGWQISDLALATGAAYAKTEKERRGQQKLGDFTDFVLLLEKCLLSNQKAADGGSEGADRHLLKGAFDWLNPSQDAKSTFAVPAKCRPSAEQWMTQVPDMATFRRAMSAAGTKMAKAGKWTGFVGPSLASAMNDWVTAGSSLSATVKIELDKKMNFAVSTYQFSEGIVEWGTHFRLAADPATGELTDKSAWSGIFLLPELWRIAYMMATTPIECLDQGGGPRGFWKNICTLQCLNPMGQFAVWASAPAAAPAP